MGVLRPAALDLARHVAQLGAETKPGRRVTTAHRANERTGLVEGQRSDIRAEVVPEEILTEILLDVRQVERRDDGIAILEILTDRSNSFRAAEVPDHRHQHV